MIGRHYAFPGQRVGRPRDCWHVTDYRQRIDALAIRREVIQSGKDLRTIRALDVTHGAGESIRTDSVQVVALSCPVYGVRLWLLCPRCGARRVHLYHVRSGVGCRACLRIGYASRRRP